MTKMITMAKKTKKLTCHFWANFSERPGILPFRVKIRTNPGTFGKIRQKVAKQIFEKTTTHRGLLLCHEHTVATPDE